MVFHKIFKRNSIIIFLFSILLISWANSGFCRDYKLKNVYGQDVLYQDITSSSKTILFIWTTWCPYCRTELKNLNVKYDFLKDFDIYYVNVGERATKVKKFLKKNKIKNEIVERVIIDRGSVIADKFYVTGIPAYIFLKDSQYLDSSLYLSKDIILKVFAE